MSIFGNPIVLFLGVLLIGIAILMIGPQGWRTYIKGAIVAAVPGADPQLCRLDRPEQISADHDAGCRRHRRHRRPHHPLQPRQQAALRLDAEIGIRGSGFGFRVLSRAPNTENRTPRLGVRLSGKRNPAPNPEPQIPNTENRSSLCLA